MSVDTQHLERRMDKLEQSIELQLGNLNRNFENQNENLKSLVNSIISKDQRYEEFTRWVIKLMVGFTTAVTVWATGVKIAEKVLQ